MFRLERKHSLLISNYAIVPASVSLVHPIGIVIGRGVKLGSRVRIFQNVTLGGKEIGSAMRDEFPTVGDDTTIFSGAVIVGKVRIGKNCIVGANSVVLHDIPDNCVAVGAPARVVRKVESEE
jgi:serine O-acetyltransferase